MSQSLPSHIYSVLITLAQTNLILPNAAVAEVLGQEVIKSPPAGAPPWMIGQTQWQLEDVPIVSIEGMLGEEIPPMHRRCRVVVLHAPLQAAALAVVAQAYPLIVTLNEIALQPRALEDGQAELMLSRVQVANRSALIPDLDALTRQARQYID